MLSSQVQKRKEVRGFAVLPCGERPSFLAGPRRSGLSRGLEMPSRAGRGLESGASATGECASKCDPRAKRHTRPVAREREESTAAERLTVRCSLGSQTSEPRFHVAALLWPGRLARLPLRRAEFTVKSSTNHERFQPRGRRAPSAARRLPRAPGQFGDARPARLSAGRN